MKGDRTTHFERKIGRYDVVGKLATGGMAEILLGRLTGPLGFEKPVVIKRILPNLARTPSFAQMFLDEARIVADIRHPNVVHVNELGIDGEELFMVMEYLEGESVAGILRRLWSEKRSMDPVAAALIAAEASAGLHAAHELCDATGRALGLVHRDISPSNLFVTYTGHVKVLDFGVAKAAFGVAHTETGVVKGKTPYMSPEQSQAQPLDRRSDIFSLGIVLFEMCTMKRLFQRDNPLLVFRAICQDPIPSIAETRNDVPKELDRIGKKALARAAEERYSTALEMRRDLLAVARRLTSSEPEELLAAMMRELFAERMGEKTKLRLNLERGTEVVGVPEAETDLGISIASVGAETSSPGSVVRRRRLFGVLAVGAAAGALVAIGLSLGASKNQRPGALLSDPSSSARTTAGVLVPPSRRLVAIAIQTQPSGAEVLVSGERRGIAPMELQLPFGADNVPVELVLEGHPRRRLDVRPDVDQRLVVVLEREAVTPSKSDVTRRGARADGPVHSARSENSGPVERPAASNPEPPASAKPLGSGFHRFD